MLSSYLSLFPLTTSLSAFKVFVNQPKMGGERAEFREKVSYLFYKQDWIIFPLPLPLSPSHSLSLFFSLPTLSQPSRSFWICGSIFGIANFGSQISNDYFNWFFQLKEAIETSFENFKSRFEERCETDNEKALRESIDYYKTKMEAPNDGDKLFLDKSDFEKKHNENKDSAIRNFKGIKKMGGEKFSDQKFLEKVSYFFFKTSFNQFLCKMQHPQFLCKMHHPQENEFPFSCGWRMAYHQMINNYLYTRNQGF